MTDRYWRTKLQDALIITGVLLGTTTVITGLVVFVAWGFIF